MISFGQIAQHIVGKPVEQVMRTVRRDEDYPSDIAGIVTKKYTFGITISNHSCYTRNRSFVVNSIIAIHGRDRPISQATAGSSSRQIRSHSGYTSPAVPTNNSTYKRRSTLPSAHQHHVRASELLESFKVLSYSDCFLFVSAASNINILISL